MNDQEYAEYVKNKRIVVVSHSRSLIGKEKGPLVDSYDLVVRINDSIPIPDKLKIDIGTRCDILYTSMSRHFQISKDPRHIPKSRVKVLCRPTPLTLGSVLSMPAYNVKFWHEDLVKVLEGIEVETRVVKKEQYLPQLVECNGKLPFTGFAGVWDLLSFDVKEVFMLGFNFFLGGTCSEYAQLPKTPQAKKIWKAGTGLITGKYHTILPQVKYLQVLLERDSRLKIDEELTQILNNLDDIIGAKL
jgi:hypothetical protein